MIKQYTPQEAPKEEELKQRLQKAQEKLAGQQMLLKEHKLPVIVLVESKETRDKVAALNAGAMGRDTDPFYGAPAVAIVFGHKDVVPTWFEDACLVAGNLLNAAHAVGVDSCFIYRAKEVFETDEGRALLKEWGLDGDYVGVANCILGYGDGPAPEPKPRKDGYVRIV